MTDRTHTTGTESFFYGLACFATLGWLWIIRIMITKALIASKEQE